MLTIQATMFLKKSALSTNRSQKSRCLLTGYKKNHVIYQQVAKITLSTNGLCKNHVIYQPVAKLTLSTNWLYKKLHYLLTGRKKLCSLVSTTRS